MNIWQIIFQQPIFNLLIFLSFIFGGNFGVAIIVLTIIIRLILYPSFQKTLEISKAQRDLQPKINELREKHKDDKTKQNQEMMKLFQENKVNPFSSCLPSIIQIVILLALYSVLRAGVDPSTTHKFLYDFMPKPEHIGTHFLIFDLTKPDLWILPFLAGGLQFWQTWLMMKKTKGTTENKKSLDKTEEQKPKDSQAMFQKAFSNQMLYFFPIITVIFARQFPAALSLYWTVNTAFSVYQQYLVNQELDLLFRKITKKPDKIKIEIRKKELK